VKRVASALSATALLVSATTSTLALESRLTATLYTVGRRIVDQNRRILRDAVVASGRSSDATSAPTARSARLRFFFGTSPHGRGDTRGPGRCRSQVLPMRQPL